MLYVLEACHAAAASLEEVHALEAADGIAERDRTDEVRGEEQ